MTIVFDFSWDDCNTPGEIGNNGYAKFFAGQLTGGGGGGMWGVNGMHYGVCENGQF